jgi:hypothetical protein
VQLATSAWSLSAAGVCGASALALSAPLSSPSDFAPDGGRMTMFLANLTSTEPIHIQPRCVYTDATGTERAIPLTTSLLSNAQAYASAQSAAQMQTLLVLLCGQDVVVPLQGVAGSAIQIIVSPASGIASATVVSGLCALWRM